MKFVTDQQFENYKLEWIAEEQLPKFYKKV